MLYTRKGDNGTTKTFSCDQRVSKSSLIAEALGTVDEINSFLGVVKTNPDSLKFSVPDGRNFVEIIDDVQQNLFIVQAEIAGAEKHIEEEKIKSIEAIVDAIEKDLPPIRTFFVSGGTNLGATFDFARTLVRRAERRTVAVSEEAKTQIDANTLAYLNRLSSLFYALARYSNHKSGIPEQAPTYK